jgi:hypothetical protein
MAADQQVKQTTIERTLPRTALATRRRAAARGYER